MTQIVRNNLRPLTGGTLLLLLAVFMVLLRQEANNWFMETSSDAGFVLTDVDITGLARTRNRDIEAVLDIDNGMPMLAIDLGDLQARIEALPWVKQVEINRVLPGKLFISVTEREPYALSQRNGQVSLIDPDGASITDRGLAAYSDLILIVGEVDAEDLRAFDRLKDAAPALAGRIKSAVRVDGRRWDIIFKNGVRVKLPAALQQPYGLHEAWTRFEELNRKHQLLEREVSVLDLRLADRLVARVTPDGRRKMQGKEWAL